MELLNQNYKFPKVERLHLTKDFKKVYDSGIAYHSRKLVLFTLFAPDVIRKIGFVTGKKVGKAVTRNRVRRLLREAYRLNKNSLVEGIELVVVAKRDSAELSFKEIEQELLRLFKKAGLVKR
ncbi:MAG: ribonuclease P protein component [bacterium]|nr:ribonuclease P protein component [bacterium]